MTARSLILAVAVAVAALVASPDASARHAGSTKGARKSKKARRYETRKNRVAGGTHWRFVTENGPVHIWIPGGYDRSTAGMVIYIHGYFSTVDEAWRDHKLARQFRKSRQNAMFVVAAGPTNRKESVRWLALGDLKKAIRRAGFRLPNGAPIAIGHSAGYQTLARWVDNKLLAQLILLDAMYGRRPQFHDFIGTGKRSRLHKMIVVGSHTVEKSRAFVKKYPRAVFKDKIPSSYAGFTRREKRAKLLYVRSQYGHMEMVTNGKVIPLLLRLTPLRHL